MKHFTFFSMMLFSICLTGQNNATLALNTPHMGNTINVKSPQLAKRLNAETWEAKRVKNNVQEFVSNNLVITIDWFFLNVEIGRLKPVKIETPLVNNSDKIQRVILLGDSEIKEIQIHCNAKGEFLKMIFID